MTKAPDARKVYEGPDKKSLLFYLSSYGRYREVNEFLREHYLPKTGSINALLVGIGRDTNMKSCGGANCAASHIEFAEMLERSGKEYRMTVLDVDKEAIKAAKNRNFIFTSDEEYDGAEGTVPVPETFRKKRAAGEIKFVEGDIVTADISQYGPFDVVQCFNVLCHVVTSPFEENHMLNEIRYDTIRSAMSNMARNTRQGGIIVIDDVIEYDDISDIRSPGHSIILSLANEEEMKMMPVNKLCKGKDYLFFRKGN